MSCPVVRMFNPSDPLILSGRVLQQVEQAGVREYGRAGTREVDFFARESLTFPKF